MLKTIYETIVGWIFPRLCLACRKVLLRCEVDICTDCLGLLPEMDPFFRGAKGIRQKFLSHIPIVHASALYHFRESGRVLSIVHAIKYRSRKKGGIFLGQYYGVKLMGITPPIVCDMIIPIPLHPARMAQRGYNQSEAFAQGLAKAMGIEVVSNQLFRHRNTVSQTGKSKIERFRNVAGAFALRGQNKIEGKSILLVDDVITTGATLISAGQTLLEAGAASISVVAMVSAI